MPKQVKKSLVLSIYFTLAVSGLLVFWQVRNFDFSNYDDNVYVYENPHVLNGLSIDAIYWAFTTGYASNWHPLTWLSLMLDCQLFGPNPGMIHLVNVFFHIANTLLLFTVLKKMTGSLWPSAFVAAAFALHPMHVESVAWIPERKDVLSTLFLLLAMWAYICYCRCVAVPATAKRTSTAGVEAKHYYLLAIVLFILGLMAKPMLVTLPFLLLLLDYWPLERFGQRTVFYLVREKIPFFILSAVSSAVTFFVQRSGGAVVDAGVFLLYDRFTNAFLSYAKYIAKMFWPWNLAVFYPFGAGAPFWQIAACALLLFGISFLVVRLGRNQKYLPVGWFWFLGTLVPVIGVVQVGSQAYADRYTYIPYIGLFIIIAWALPQLLSKWTSAGLSRQARRGSVESLQRKIVLGSLIALVLTALGICAHRQVSFWNNGITLFSRAIKVTKNNWFAHNSLGVACARLGRYSEAIEVYQQAIKINPHYEEAYLNLGNAYSNLGRYSDAVDAYQQAVKIKPDYVYAYNNLGLAYGNLGRWPEAIEAHKQTVKIKPDYAETQYSLGNAYTKLNRRTEAIDAYQQAIKIKPDYAEAYNNLGFVYSSLGRYQQEIEIYRQAIKIKPDYADAYNNLGAAYENLGRYSEAIVAYKQAVKIRPDYAEAHYNLGNIYFTTGDKNSALTEYNILKLLNPQFADELLNQINK